MALIDKPEKSVTIFSWISSGLDDEETIALLKETDDEDYIRIIEEIDRQALLAERPVIEGISFVQDDEFFVIPKLEGKKKKLSPTRSTSARLIV